MCCVLLLFFLLFSVKSFGAEKTKVCFSLLPARHASVSPSFEICETGRTSEGSYSVILAYGSLSSNVSLYCQETLQTLASDFDKERDSGRHFCLKERKTKVKHSLQCHLSLGYMNILLNTYDLQFCISKRDRQDNSTDHSHKILNKTLICKMSSFTFQAVKKILA